jgi:hypothetical protein
MAFKTTGPHTEIPNGASALQVGMVVVNTVGGIHGSFSTLIKPGNKKWWSSDAAIAAWNVHQIDMDYAECYGKTPKDTCAEMQAFLRSLGSPKVTSWRLDSDMAFLSKLGWDMDKTHFGKCLYDRAKRLFLPTSLEDICHHYAVKPPTGDALDYAKATALVWVAMENL